MTEKPKSSIEVAILIYDHARLMGIPAILQTSLVQHSDSRYVVLFPDTVAQDTIRISSHKPYEPRYGISLDANRLDSAVLRGIEYLESKYGDGKIQALAERGGLASAEVRDTGGSSDGPPSRKPRNGRAKPNRGHTNGVRGGSPRRLRDASEVTRWTSSEARRIRDEWSGDG